MEKRAFFVRFFEGQRPIDGRTFLLNWGLITKRNKEQRKHAPEANIFYIPHFFIHVILATTFDHMNDNFKNNSKENNRNKQFTTNNYKILSLLH